MSELKAKAIKIIEQFPEERMEYVLKNLENLQKNFQPSDLQEKKRKSQEAWAEIHKIMAPHRDKFPKNFDYKKELQEYREQRYGIA